MSKLVYLDTSALAKLVLNEPSSPRFGTFFREQIRPPAVSTLTMLELRSLLSRRKRAGDIDLAAEQAALVEFEKLIRFELLLSYPLDDSHVRVAIDLLATLTEHPLRTLDALQLAIARGMQVTQSPRPTTSSEQPPAACASTWKCLWDEGRREASGGTGLRERQLPSERPQEGRSQEE